MPVGVHWGRLLTCDRRCADPFSVFEELFPELVTIDSAGNLTGKVVDFCGFGIVEHARTLSNAPCRPLGEDGDVFNVQGFRDS